MKYHYLVYRHDDGWHWKISRNRDAGGTTVAVNLLSFKTKAAAAASLRGLVNKIGKEHKENNIVIRYRPGEGY